MSDRNETLPRLPTHLALVPSCRRMNTAETGKEKDQYFQLDILEESFLEQEKRFEPTKDYRIYLEVDQLVKVKRDWPTAPADTYFRLSLGQFYQQDSAGNRPVPGPTRDLLAVREGKLVPEKLYVELKIHRRGPLDQGPTWAHIVARDNVTVSVRHAKIGPGAVEGELEPVDGPLREHNALLARRRTSVKNFFRGIKRTFTGDGGHGE